MNTIKKYMWLIVIVMVFFPSCKDGDDVDDGSDYIYYLNIQSQVMLRLSEDAQDETGMAPNSQMDRLSRTIYYMKQAVSENETMQGDARTKEAALITACDSLYRSYTETHPENKGNVVCIVKLTRCRKNSNGTVKDIVTLKYYQFWRENDDGGDDNPSPNQNLAKPDSLKAIDLGLSVLWTNCNVGAKQPRDYGAHLAWGDPTGRLWSGQGIGWKNDAYTWKTDNYGGNNPPDDISATELDVVWFNWGDGWRIPSYNEALELCEQCQWKLQTYGDIKWFEVIGPNGNSIIMPLAGIFGDDLSNPNRFHRGPLGLNEMGSYWTSSSCETPSTAEERGYGVNEGIITAWSFRFFPNSENDSARLYFIDYLRAYHMSIRAVHNK